MACPTPLGCGRWGCLHKARREAGVRLDLESLAVETYDMGVFSRWGRCTNPACTLYDLLDEDGACHTCVFIPAQV